MATRVSIVCAISATMMAFVSWPQIGPTCCLTPPPGQMVVNADQTVAIIWDSETKTQHFIRQASFKGEAEAFGFIVPSPSQPELEESGNEAFPYLRKLTEPETKKVPRPSGGMGCGCSATSSVATGNADAVRVLAEKQVAGFNAVVLEASASDALVGWLKEHGYAHSPEIAAWAKPYVEAGWKFTALKIAKSKDSPRQKDVVASALRMTFKTERPLFPYREPDPERAATTLGTQHRVLRIYFLADARYRGEFTSEKGWSGRVAWADRLADFDRAKLLDLLKLPATTGPREYWLTEFEDVWPYRSAPADVTFVKAADQSPVKRPPIIQYVVMPFPSDATVYACAAFIVVPPIWRRVRRSMKH